LPATEKKSFHDACAAVFGIEWGREFSALEPGEEPLALLKRIRGCLKAPKTDRKLESTVVGAS